MKTILHNLHTRKRHICSLLLLLSTVLANCTIGIENDPLTIEPTADLTIDQLIKKAEASVYQDPSRSIQFAKTALKLAELDDDVASKSTALNRLGSAYASIGQLDSALRCLSESLAIAESLRDSQLIARNTGNIGNVYLLSGDNVGAIQNYEKALEIYQTLNLETRVFAMLNNIGKSNLENGNLQEARKFFDSATRYLAAIDNAMTPIFLFNLAELNYLEGNIQTSLEKLALCEASAREFQDQRALCRTKQLRAQILMDGGQLDEAFELAIQAYQLAEKTEVKDLLKVTSETLSEIHHQRGSESLAYEFLLKTRDITEKLQSGVIKNQLSLLRAQEQQYELISLKQRNQILENQTAYRGIIILILTLLVLLALAFLYTLIRSKQRISAQNAKLEQSDEFKSRLLGVVAHDIRSPLTSLISVLELFEENKGNGIENKRLIQTMKDQSSTVLELVDELVEWVKVNIESETAASCEVIALRSLIESCHKKIKSGCEEKELTIRNQIPQTLHINSDASILTIVLRNLMLNACKFSHPRSDVIISAKVEQKMALISVKDSGVGMTDTQMETLFCSAGKSSKGTAGEMGHGIGLLLCKELMKKIDGDIKAKSVTGEGSEFTVVIPL